MSLRVGDCRRGCRQVVVKMRAFVAGSGGGKGRTLLVAMCADWSPCGRGFRTVRTKSVLVALLNSRSLHIYPTLLHIVLPTVLIGARNGA
jgi:hypothetical protein